jgi:hypothetical protein
MGNKYVFLCVHEYISQKHTTALSTLWDRHKKHHCPFHYWARDCIVVMGTI